MKKSLFIVFLLTCSFAYGEVDKVTGIEKVEPEVALTEPQRKDYTEKMCSLNCIYFDDRPIAKCKAQCMKQNGY